MSPLDIAALLSFLGAVLFSLGGFLTARVLCGKKQILEKVEQLSLLRDDLSCELESTRKNQAIAAKQIQDLRDQVGLYAERQDKLMKKSQELDGVVQKEEWLRNQAEIRLEEVESSFKLVRQKLEQSVVDGQTREDSLRHELEALKANKREHISRLEEENEAIRNKLLTAEQDWKRLSHADEKAKSMEKDNIRFRLEIAHLLEDQKKHALAKDENADLRRKLVQLASLKSEVERLRIEKPNHPSYRIATETDKQDKTMTQPAIGTERGRSAALHSALRKLMDTSKSRCAVIADDHGLLLAGEGGEDGTEAEALGLAGASINDNFDRFRHQLPIGPLHELVITDQNQIVISIQPFVTQSGTFFLATLTTGHSPDPTTMRHSLKHLSSLLD